MDLRERLQATLGAGFTVEQELGGGGMARVYVATEHELGRRVVVKVLPPDISAGIDIERFQREIMLAASLQHPHIVPLLSTGARDGLLFYTMPFIAGESLRARLTREGQLPVSDTVRLLRDVVDALAFAHAHGIVHRDVKPDNVLVSGKHALVTDFGVAKALSTATDPDPLTATGVTLGTPSYMAPEQAAAEPNIDHRADIYAVGVLAYELLTGRPPFVGASAQQVMAAHVTHAPDPITRHRESVPDELAVTVMRCLAKKPADRWQTAEELLARLETMPTSSDAVHARRLPASRRRMAIGVAIAAALVLVLGWTTLANRGRKAATTHLIAVIPIAPPASATAPDVLPDRVTDEVTTALVDARAAGLSVINRGSAEQFRGKVSSIDSIRSVLRADHIVTLKVSRRGPTIHVVADLVNTASRGIVQTWLYDESEKTAHSVPGKIAAGVIEELGLRAESGRRRRKRHEPTREAADAYQRGLIVYRHMESKADLDRAMRYFRQAMAADSQYAEPYAAAASAHEWASGWDNVPPAYAYAMADSLARRAVALDDESAEGHAAFGQAEAVLHWRWDVAEREIMRAIELDPNSAFAHINYGFLLMFRGELRHALDEGNEALRLDPADAAKYSFLIIVHTMLGEPDSAITRFRQVRELAPGYLFGGFFIADGFRNKGMVDSALALDSAASAQAKHPTPGLVISLVAANRRTDAIKAYRELEAAAKQGTFMLSEELARAAMTLGDREAALRWLREAMDKHSDGMLFERFLPEMRPLRSDPRYQAMLRAMGLPY